MFWNVILNWKAFLDQDIWQSLESFENLKIEFCYLLRKTNDKIKNFLMLLWHQTDSAIIDNSLQAKHEVEP